MKAICTLFFFIFLFSFQWSTAQSLRHVDHSRVQKRAFEKPSTKNLQFRMETETLFPAAFNLDCSSEVAVFEIEDAWGELSGMNEFMDLQKAQRFFYDGAATYTINEVSVFFSRADIVNDGLLKVNIYDVAINGGPGTLLGSSEPINASDIVIPGEEDPALPTAFTFSTPPLVSSHQFFVSVDFSELYATQDTVGIFNSLDECGYGGTTWDLFNDGTTWSNYVTTWNTNADLLISCVVEKGEDIVLPPIDTAFTPGFLDDCGLEVTALRAGDEWGWVAGMNDFGDREKAQRFDVAGAQEYRVSEVAVYFNQAAVVGNGEVSVKIYELSSNGDPGALLGTSDPLTVSQLATDPELVIPTLFTFSEKPGLTGGSFFVSVNFSELYDTQDTVGIFNTVVGCGASGSSYDLFSDGRWFPFSNADSWQLDIDLLIFATLEQISTDVNDLTPEEAGLHLTAAYPNPASKQITLDFSLDQREDITISIHQANGQLIRQEYLGSRAAGTHREQLDLGSLSNGVYFYTFRTTQTRIMRKFVVQK